MKCVFRCVEKCFLRWFLLQIAHFDSRIKAKMSEIDRRGRC